MPRIISLAFVLAVGLGFAAPALAASPQHVTVHHTGTTTVTHGGSTYHITAIAHGFTVMRGSAHGMVSVPVHYQHPGSHGLIYVRNGCIVYIDYNTGAWTGYYYNVC